jgi:hypothetical protein
MMRTSAAEAKSELSRTRNNAMKTRGKPFEKGNPGRPRGSRNKTTELAERLMAKDVEGVVDAVITAAKTGDMTACRIILDRLVPIRRGRPVEITLPPAIDAIGVADASAEVVAAVGAGELTPEEGRTLAQILEARRRAIETSEHERRLEVIEDAMKLKNIAEEERERQRQLEMKARGGKRW